MRLDRFAWLALLLATPAAAQGDELSRAQELVETGRAREAVSLLEALSASQPRNTDILRRLAQAQAAADDLGAALDTIDRAIALAPSDLDLSLVRGYILLWSDRVDEARRQSAAIAASDAAYPGLDQLQEAITRRQQAPGRASNAGLSLSAGISGIEFESGTSDTWYSANLSAFSDIAAIGTATLGIDHERRRSSDTRLTARLDRRIGDGSVFLAGSLTPDADFREEWSLSAGGSLAATSRIELLIDGRYSEYPDNSVFVLRPGVRLELTSRLSLTGQWINLFQDDGGHRSGVSGRLDYALGDAAILFSGAATYPDTEAGVTRQVRSVFAGAAVPLSEELTLRAAIEHDDRSLSYERTAATIGLGWRFGS